jgi:NAD dependent epimerase/dehydratase family enzyme
MASARVEPTKLQASCYPYFHPELTSALKHVLQK